MRLRIRLEIDAEDMAYVGMAIDEPLPEDFYNYDKFLLGIIPHDPAQNKFTFAYNRTIDFIEGKHYIAVSTTINLIITRMMIRIEDAAGNLLYQITHYGPFSETFPESEHKQYIVGFKVTEQEFSTAGLYNGWYPYGQEPFKPDKGSSTLIDLGELMEKFWPMMQDMMSMMISMMMMMAMMQAMTQMMTSITGAI